MALILKHTTDHTTSSFRLHINRGSVPPNCQDKFYIKGQWFSEEPVETPHTILTSGSEAFIDFTGLSSGKLYWVESWRYVNGIFDSVATHENMMSYSHVKPYCGYTLDSIITPSYGTWAEDWSDGIQANWRTMLRYPSLPRAKVLNDVVMGGPFLRLGDVDPLDYMNLAEVTRDANYYISKQYFKHNSPATITCKMRFKNAWTCLFGYSSEAEYWGFASRFGSLNSLYNAEIVNTITGILDDTVYELKLVFDGNTTIQYYKDNILEYTDILPAPLTTPYCIMIACGLYSDSGYGYVDYGVLTVEGNVANVWASFDANDTTVSNTNASFEVGQEVQGNPGTTDMLGIGVNNWHEWAGGVTVQAINGYDTGYKVSDRIYMLSSPPVSMFPTGMFPKLIYGSGTFTVDLPRVSPILGYWYNKLYIAGSTRSGGTLIVQVRKSDGTLIPDNEIVNNSTGFTPTYGSFTIIDLSEVSTFPIYISVVGYNPTNNIEASVPNTGPPIFKGAYIEFTEKLTVTVTANDTSPDNAENIQGQCSDQATITLQADNQQATFSDIIYDRNQLPLNTWSATVSNMQLGNNVITVTASL